MKTMSRPCLLAVLLGLGVALPAEAQRADDDAPIPYDDGATDDAPVKPKKSRKSERLREEDEDAQERDERLGSTDDPNFGVGGEVTAGLMLLEGSRAGVDPRFSFGVRFVWEWGRLIPEEFIRELFFVDLQWRYAVTSDGTSQVNAWASQHYFTLAPAVAYPFGNLPVAVYGQLGVGVNASFTGVRIDTAELPLQGARFLFQYGIGLRGRPAVTEDQAVRITWRVEVTRYLRGYLNDTLFSGAVGVIF